MGKHYSWRSKEERVSARPKQPPLAKWDDLVPIFGDRAIRDLRATCEGITSGSELRGFLSWASLSQGDSSGSLLEILRASTGQASQHELSALIAETIVEYVGHYRTKRAENWPRRAFAVLGKTFQRLGDLDDQRYPSFHPKLLPTHRTAKLAPSSLGRSEWLELAGCAPRDREQMALSLVSEAAQAQFEQAEAIFKFGQSVLRSGADEQHCSLEARNSIRTLLHCLARQLDETGECNLVSDYGNLNMAKVWEDAGLPKNLLKRRYMEALELQLLALSCLGPTWRATTAIKIMFCCASGWNRQQIEDLPADPYAYRDADQAGLGETAFLSEFKSRAGHFVNALLERGFRSTQLSADQKQVIWHDTTKEAPAHSSFTLNDGNLLNLLDRYKLMVDTIRPLDKHENYSPFFFVSLMYKGLSRSLGAIQKHTESGTIISRREITYQNIRQSYISSARTKFGSLDTTRHISNHAGTSVILSHYDDPIIQQELDESIAFWQNCMQAALIDRNNGLLFKLKVPDKQLEWFHHMAKVAGITACLGIKSRKLSISERQYLDFKPSPESFRELYVLRRAIISSRLQIGTERWRVQALPLLALANAIRKQAFTNGLRAQYLSAARSAFRDLVDGKIAFPRIFGV